MSIRIHLPDRTTITFNELSKAWFPGCILITYTVDGEPSPPLYAEEGFDEIALNKYLQEWGGGVIQNVRCWDFRSESNFYHNGAEAPNRAFPKTGLILGDQEEPKARIIDIRGIQTPVEGWIDDSRSTLEKDERD